MSFVCSGVLIGEAKLYKHPRSQTLYVSIPAKVVQDSTFAFKGGQKVSIRYDPETRTITIEQIEETKESK